MRYKKYRIMFSWFNFWSSETVSQPTQEPSIPEGSESSANTSQPPVVNTVHEPGTVVVEAVIEPTIEPATIESPVVNTVTKPLVDSEEAVKILDELIAELFDLAQDNGQKFGPARNAPNNGIGIKYILNQAPMLVMQQTASEINNVRSKLRPTKINAQPASRSQRPGMAELDRIFRDGVMTYLQKTHTTT